jgi:dTDP-4-amino-4,6-dideoxygalactose transaminase
VSDIRVSAPRVTAAEIDEIVAVLRSGMLAAGPVVERLEAALTSVTGASHAVAVSSGTAALHCAMAALQIGPDTEVIATPFSFVGSVNPVLMQGARLRFVDIELADFGPDIAAIEAAINDRTAAVVVVDLFGLPVDADPVIAATTSRGVPVVEDSCQAIGATYRERPAGNLFDVGCFSFYATKNVMCGEGGALITDDESVAAAARRFRQHGMSGAYDYTGLGYNYRMTDVLAALAAGQLDRVEDITAERSRHAAVLSEGLRGIPGLILPTSLPDRTSAWHQYVVRVTPESGTDRDTLAGRLAQRGVHAAVYYPRPLTAYPHVAAATVGDTRFPNAERAAREVLALPVHPELGREQLDRVIDAVRGSLHG